MKISYNWLKKYVDTDLSADEIGVILTETGLEVESVEKLEAIKGGLEGVFVGEVLTCEKHPDADKLKVTTVSIGGQEDLQIVCGAPNVAKGQKVIVATVGCVLYPNPEEPFKIKSSKIRGVESNGMLCAEDELGLGKSHDGILVLDPQTPIGMKASTYFDLEEDYQIEIGLTPNRADAMGHIGVARDLIAYLNVHQQQNLKLNLPQWKALKSDQQNLEINIAVKNSQLCPRYLGVTISGVEVKPSPAWLQKALRNVGLSPINNVVDVTNFVMRELGTPLHAFDAAQVKGQIVVQNAKDGVKFKTLDETEHNLQSDDLMITNGEENLCIAGVFGGFESGIKSTTQDVFLEAAYFNPISVRKTAKRLGINSDASFRFERGIDIDLLPLALNRAANLILELAGGQIGMDVKELYQNPFEPKKITFDYQKCNAIIGASIEVSVINQILENLDITVGQASNGVVELSIPNYRVDVTREIDVIEEVLRIYGFNKVPIPSKLNSSLSVFPNPNPERYQDVMTEFLVGKGFQEMMNNSLVPQQFSQKFDKKGVQEDHNVSLLNPLSQELNVMRQNLLYGGLKTIEHNQNRQNPNLKLMEFGKVYHKYGEEYHEEKRLIILISGLKKENSWNETVEKVSYYTLKGIVDSMFTRLGLQKLIQEDTLKNELFEDGVSLHVLKQKVGEIGWVSQELKKFTGIKQDVFVAELNWDAILQQLKNVKIKYTELPKTFAVRRDFSLLLNQAVTFKEIQELAKKVDRKMLKEVQLFDVYEGKNLPEGKKSYAVSFTFQDLENTLKDEQIDAVMHKIHQQLVSELKAELR